MNKTKIEWTDYTINPIKGLCKNNCWYCYARKMYERFKWDKHIRQDFSVFADIAKIKKPSRIFVGSMHDIFGDWILHHWINDIIVYCSHPQLRHHTFLFLTKFPERYLEFKFPKNCWLGTTITSQQDTPKIWQTVKDKNNISFVSFEPLLTQITIQDMFFKHLDWIIIGGLTPKPKHKKEWVQNLINQARKFNIPIFIKTNLKWHEKIQEFPDSNNIINDKEIK